MVTNTLWTDFKDLMSSTADSLHKNMKFFVKNLFSNCKLIRRELRIGSHLLNKFLLERLRFLRLTGYRLLTKKS